MELLKNSLETVKERSIYSEFTNKNSLLDNQEPLKKDNINSYFIKKKPISNPHFFNTSFIKNN